MTELKAWTVLDLEQLAAAVAEIRATIPLPAILLLQGPMGAGKTQFVRSWCGVDVVSPTYALHHSYQLSPSGPLGEKLIEVEHFDLYRLQSEDDLESTGFWDLINDPQSWVFIEWPERLQIKHLPLHRPRFLIDFKCIENQIADQAQSHIIRQLTLFRL